MKNIEILAYEQTPLGPLCLRRRELLSRPGTVVTEITLNHEFLMSSYHTASERALSEGALSVHTERASAGGNPAASRLSRLSGPDRMAGGLSVLIGGLGLGYTAQAVLESDRVSRVDVVELLPQVIDWLRGGLVPLSDSLSGDARFRPVHGDVYESLARVPSDTGEGVVFPSGGYDLILIDVDHSPDERLGDRSDSFYSVAGLTRARAHLAVGGVLGVWSYAENSSFSTSMREVFDHVRVIPVRFHNIMVESDQVDWLFFGC